MGSVFGKETVLEPVFKVVLQRPSPPAQTTYQIREYGKRFVAEVDYSASENTGRPFRTLAGYIGVFGDPKNEGKTSMAMTAPVAMERSGGGGGVPMAMTAPVAMEKVSDKKRMKFFLPAEYDDLEKIPTPTDPSVKIKEVPPAVGAVHRFSGSLSDALNDKKAKELSAQLRQDGIDRMTEEHVVQNYQYWGFNPPFTIPMFRRNEVWIDLTNEEATMLQEKFQTIEEEEKKTEDEAAVAAN